jgi:ABC-type antimicrobial peptide transport system permease subunit
VSERRFVMGLILSFGAIALVLAAIGVSGVLSLAVAERTREMGIRLALGASPRGLVGLLVKQALALTVTGVIAGILLALMMSPLVASQLFGVGRSDPMTIASVAGVLFIVAFIASLVPAARVMRVDPVTTLRSD